MKIARVLLVSTLLPTVVALPASALPPARAGREVPELVLEDLNGQAWRLADLRGQVVHLAFVAVWCEPCRQEAEGLRELALRHGRQGYTLLVLGVPTRQDPERLRTWAEREGLSELPVCYDADGKASRAFGVDLLPRHILIDRAGAVDLVTDGLTKELETRVRVLLSGGGAEG